jgi:hypothetical protein
VLDVRRSTAEHLAALLRDHRAVVGTRRGRRALGCFRQAVLILRWFLDGTRLAQLARDNGLSSSTAYRYLLEGLTVLAAGPRICIPRWSGRKHQRSPKLGDHRLYDLYWCPGRCWAAPSPDYPPATFGSWAELQTALQREYGSADLADIDPHARVTRIRIPAAPSA